MAYPHIDTRADLDVYEQAVADFYAAEELVYLASKIDPDSGEAPESYFSWSACECCGRPLGGNRHEMLGVHGLGPDAAEPTEYSVCDDCVYYAEYGTVDDVTLMDLDD